MILLQDVINHSINKVGNKAFNLSILYNKGFNILPGLLLSGKHYKDHINSNFLDIAIENELKRRPLSDLRWEEVWDLGLRIRNLFLQTNISASILEDLKHQLKQLNCSSYIVRSSSNLEDSHDHSCAGMHESILDVNISNIENTILKIWASLWSDSTIMYQKELNLHMVQSSMPILIQPYVKGDFSGIIFTKSINHRDELTIECVRGTNDSLVDGKTKPERWQICGKVHSCINKSTSTILTNSTINNLVAQALKIETLFDAPQDIEWTYYQNQLFILQSRNITTPTISNNELWEEQDKRPWYNSLKLSFTELTITRNHIRKELLPQLNQTIRKFEEIELNELNIPELIDEIRVRNKSLKHWNKIYWKHFIPYAHGVRLFGQYYNDIVVPDDPYEFIHLLQTNKLISTRRNTELQKIKLLLDQEQPVNDVLDNFIKTYKGNVYSKEQVFNLNKTQLKEWLIKTPYKQNKEVLQPKVDLTLSFLKWVPVKDRGFVNKLLDLARDSYALRDNDNILFSNIEFLLIEACKELYHRTDEYPNDIKPIIKSYSQKSNTKNDDELVKVKGNPTKTTAFEQRKNQSSIKYRRIKGQPASEGIASGKVHFINAVQDLFTFEEGNILVCDAIDPNMTFIVPMAAGIIERRGGMLIHGAIIAREYHIPCITGIPNLHKIIAEGDYVTIDAYQGVLIVEF